MALTITKKIVRSDLCDHAAVLNGDGNWIVSWLPGRSFDRDHAMTAVAIADTLARVPGLTRDHALWPYIVRWSADLGLDADEAVRQAI